MFKTLQKIGKSFMLPIAILPAAGLLLGIGSALSSEATLLSYPMLNIPFLQAIFKIMAAAGNTVFSNLSLLLCIGLCIGLAQKDKGVAALSGVVGLLIMNGTIGVMLSIFNPEGSGIDTGVVGALVMGAVVVKLHNKYRSVQLPQVLGFFGGSRFVPIITSVAAILVGAAFYLVWPPLQSACNGRKRNCLHGRDRYFLIWLPDASVRRGRSASYDLSDVLVYGARRCGNGCR